MSKPEEKRDKPGRVIDNKLMIEAMRKAAERIRREGPSDGRVSDDVDPRKSSERGAANK